VRGLPRNITTDEMLEMFGEYGSVLCISGGSRRETAGTAYILYKFEEEAQAAIRALSGLRVHQHSLVLQIHNPSRMMKPWKNSSPRNASSEAEEGKEAQTQDFEPEGTFLHMLSVVKRAARGHKPDTSNWRRPIRPEECNNSDNLGHHCSNCGGLRL